MNFGKPFSDDTVYVITQTFDEHEQRRKYNGWAYYNGGIDYYFNNQPTGYPIRASEAGDVVEATKDPSSSGGYGNYVKLLHSNGWKTLYGHLQQYAVSAGQHVEKGDIIGYSDSTGNSTGPHLHFEMRNANNIPVDPELYYGEVASSQDQVAVDQSVPSFKIIATGLRIRSKPVRKTGNVLFTPPINTVIDREDGDEFLSDGYYWRRGIVYVATKSRDGVPFIQLLQGS